MSGAKNKVLNTKYNPKKRSWNTNNNVSRLKSTVYVNCSSHPTGERIIKISAHDFSRGDKIILQN